MARYDLSMRDNPAHLYRTAAKRIIAKFKETMVDLLDQGRTPDLYWKMEQAIVDAMKVADQMGCDRTRTQLMDIMKEFEGNDGSSSN